MKQLDVEVMVAAYKNGASLKEIGETHGVCIGTVRNKILGRVVFRPRGRPPQHPKPAPLRTLDVDSLPE